MNSMDSRNRSAFEIVADLKKLGTVACRLGVLGSHGLDAKQVAGGLVRSWGDVCDMIGFEPERLVTGCVDHGAEKAARLAAKECTGKLAAVFHRAEATYGVKEAERLRDIILAQQCDALLLLTDGGKCCKHARERFGSLNKKVFELEVE
jgi:hypothetical protein